jgi:hypothetical protein
MCIGKPKNIRWTLMCVNRAKSPTKHNSYVHRPGHGTKEHKVDPYVSRSQDGPRNISYRYLFGLRSNLQCSVFGLTPLLRLTSLLRCACPIFSVAPVLPGLAGAAPPASGGTSTTRCHHMMGCGQRRFSGSAPSSSAPPSTSTDAQ